MRYVLPRFVVERDQGQVLALVPVGVSAGLDTKYLSSEALWVQGQRDRYTEATGKVNPLRNSPVWVRVSLCNVCISWGILEVHVMSFYQPHRGSNLTLLRALKSRGIRDGPHWLRSRKAFVASQRLEPCRCWL